MKPKPEGRKIHRSATELLSSLRLDVKDPQPRKKPKRKSEGKVQLASLMTQDVRFRSYRDAIWKRIDERLFYPEGAVGSKARAKVVLRFEVTREGQLATLELVESSGFRLFDEEALMAVRMAAPFPRFPPTISARRIAIRSEILYEP